MGGAQTGTYMVQPKHMKVEFPSNVNDISITADGNYAQPDHVATEMSFFRFRCRCTELFREVIDASWEAGSETQDLPYESVLQFDKKFNNILIEFDTVFNKARSVLTVVQTEDPRYKGMNPPSIHWAMGHFCMNSRFARLHRPYLVRGAKDPKYTYSRMVCLRSARRLMELGNLILTTAKNLVAFKLWAINHDMYVAAIILVMDFCYNRTEPRAKERRDEILDCFHALKRNENGAATMPSGLQKLEKIFRDSAGLTEGTENLNMLHGWPVTSVEVPTPPLIFCKPPSTNLSKQAPEYPRFTSDADTSFIERGNFNDSPARQTWADFDFGLLQNIDFDPNLDTSLFDELFQNLENNNDLI
jgi:hypothetical protein